MMALAHRGLQRWGSTPASGQNLVDCCSELGSAEQAMSESPRSTRNPKVLNLAGFPNVHLVKMWQTRWCSLQVAEVLQKLEGPKLYPDAHLVLSSSSTSF